VFVKALTAGLQLKQEFPNSSVKLRDLYKRHNLKMRITDVYSEASIGKGYYEELAV
jgi:hypothetical protein